MMENPRRAPWLATLFTTLLLAWVPVSGEARLKPKEAYPVHWHEHGGRIDVSSVCFDYNRSSLDHRRCRSYALDLFAEKCRHHRRAFQDAGGTERERQRALKRKFCAAWRRLSP